MSLFFIKEIKQFGCFIFGRTKSLLRNHPKLTISRVTIKQQNAQMIGANPTFNPTNLPTKILIVEQGVAFWMVYGDNAFNLVLLEQEITLTTIHPVTTQQQNNQMTDTNPTFNPLLITSLRILQDYQAGEKLPTISPIRPA